MNHHGNKQRKSGVTACTTVQQVRLQPPPVASSLAIRHWGGGWPPALLSGGNGNGGIGPFGTGGDTHTLSLSLKMPQGRQGHCLALRMAFSHPAQAGQALVVFHVNSSGRTTSLGPYVILCGHATKNLPNQAGLQESHNQLVQL